MKIWKSVFEMPDMKFKNARWRTIGAKAGISRKQNLHMLTGFAIIMHKNEKSYLHEIPSFSML